MQSGVNIMPVIKPVSDLRNRFAAISEICHSGEPVFMTKNGEGDLVVMSMAAYERQQARLELYAKLLEAQEEERQGMPMVSHAEMMKRLRSRVKHAG